jgi:oligopeptide transport system substrate-binding protein
MSWLWRILIIAALGVGLLTFHNSRQSRELRVTKAAREGILLIGNGTELETLDPHIATGAPEHKVISALFEGLTASLPDQPDADGPGAAVSWQPTDNFKRWTFQLQPQGKWSDGEPVTAEDFVFAYERILNPALAATYAEMLYPIQGAAEYNKGTLKDFTQVGVKALSPLTLEITLTGPAPYLPGVLKHYTWFPVPRHLVLKHGAAHDPTNPWTRQENLAGNGPFKLLTWQFTQQLKVERNPHYWDSSSVQLNELHFFPITADSTEERAFQDGQLHITATVPLTLIPGFRKTQDQRFHNEPILGTAFYRINTAKAPFTDKRVRRALALSVDRKALVENVLKAGQIVATGLTPPGIAKGYTTPDLLRFDPKEGQRLLAEAGFLGGKGFPDFEILINTNEAHRILAQAIQAMWKQNLGIPAKISNQDWQVYLETQRKGDYTLCRAGWLGDYPDPMTFLSIWRTGDGNNQTGWSNAEYDLLVTKSTIEADPAARYRLLEQAEAMLLEESPIIPLYWQNHTYLMRPELKGHEPSVLEHRCYKSLRLQ